MHEAGRDRHNDLVKFSWMKTSLPGCAPRLEIDLLVKIYMMFKSLHSTSFLPKSIQHLIEKMKVSMLLQNILWRLVNPHKSRRTRINFTAGSRKRKSVRIDWPPLVWWVLAAGCGLMKIQFSSLSRVKTSLVIEIFKTVIITSKWFDLSCAYTSSVIKPNSSWWKRRRHLKKCCSTAGLTTLIWAASPLRDYYRWQK